jgi:putative transposase
MLEFEPGQHLQAGDIRMVKKRFQAEQIIGNLRKAEVEISKRQTIGQVVKKLGVTEQTYYRWRKEYGGLRTEQ